MKMKKNKNQAKGVSLKYLKCNFDEVLILGVFVRFTLNKFITNLNYEDNAVLSALRRSNNSLANASYEEIHNYLSNLDDDQIIGLISNVKGILHEMEFVEIENSDGDSIYASIFPYTNHKDTDIELIDKSNGETWEIQLKCTDSTSYVQDWIDGHPDGEILVSQEIAEKMDLPSSGISNSDITVKVEKFVDEIIENDEIDFFPDHIPVLSIATTAKATFELWRRNRNGEISNQEFYKQVARITGLKISKIVAISFLLSLPVIGQITGAALIANLLIKYRNL